MLSHSAGIPAECAGIGIVSITAVVRVTVRACFAADDDGMFIATTCSGDRDSVMGTGKGEQKIRRSEAIPGSTLLDPSVRPFSIPVYSVVISLPDISDGRPVIRVIDFPSISFASAVISIRPGVFAASKALIQGKRVNAGGWTVSDAPSMAFESDASTVKFDVQIPDPEPKTAFAEFVRRKVPVATVPL